MSRWVTPLLRTAARPVAVAVVVAVLGVLGVLSWRQSRAYASGEALYRDTLRKNPSAWMAHQNLAELLAERGRTAEAITEFQAAAALQPRSAEAHFNLGLAYEHAGRISDAASEYRQAIALDPNFLKAHLALAGLPGR